MRKLKTPERRNLMLTKDEAISVLIERYNISQREAKQNYELTLSDLRLFAHDEWGRRIRGAKVSFVDKADLVKYLENLEA
jgi:hypothetical protein